MLTQVPIHKVALVTGASRGIGARVAVLLAEGGADVVLTYRSKAPRAEAVAAQIRALGRCAQPVQADLTRAKDLAALRRQVTDIFGRLDLLVLNASGGLDKDKPADYAMTLNRDAQVATVETFLPLMPASSTVMFITSHWAHFYPQQPVMDAYLPVAASKRAGEDALRERLPTLTERGIRLLVVSGDAIEGTITPKLLERAAPGAMAAHRSEVGALPTVEEFAAAIVEAAYDPARASGDTVFVGATE